MYSPPYPTQSSPLPRPSQYRSGQPRVARTASKEEVPGYTAPVATTYPIEYAESSNRHVIAQLPMPKPTSQNQHTRTRTKSSSRRPCTPALSMTTPETVSPPSIATMSPRSPEAQAQRHRAYSTTSSTSRQRPALKLVRPPNKKDISPPVPSPVYATFDDGASYRPQRTAPITPPLQTLPNTAPSANPETSFMEWDEETSALSKMKQTLKLGQHKRGPPRPQQPKPKSPDRHDNATPRSPPARPRRQSPPTESSSIRQPPTTSNFSMPTNAPIYSYFPSTSTSTSAGEPFYQGPDLTGRSTASATYIQPRLNHRRDQSTTTNQQPRAKLPHQVHRPHRSQQFHASITASHPPRHEQQPQSQSQLQPRKIEVQPHYSRRIGVDYDNNGNTDDNPGPFLANEAVAVQPPTPTSTHTTATGTSTSTEKPRRLKALMQGLVKRASGKDLKKNENGTARGTSW